MNPFFRAVIENGTAVAASTMGEDFEFLGNVFTGVFSSPSTDVAMLLGGGNNSSAQYVLKAPRAQFERVPREKEEIAWRGEQWMVLQDMQPNNEFSLVAVVVRRSRV